MLISPRMDSIAREFPSYLIEMVTYERVTQHGSCGGYFPWSFNLCKQRRQLPGIASASVSLLTTAKTDWNVMYN